MGDIEYTYQEDLVVICPVTGIQCPSSSEEDDIYFCVCRESELAKTINYFSVKCGAIITDDGFIIIGGVKYMCRKIGEMIDLKELVYSDIVYFYGN